MMLAAPARGTWPRKVARDLLQIATCFAHLAFVLACGRAGAPICGSPAQIISRPRWTDQPAIEQRMKRHAPRLLALHHSGTLDDGRRTGEQLMRVLLSYSQRRDRWGDVPYHFVIDRGGRIFEGRRLDFAPDTRTRHDVRGHVAICLSGDLTRQPLPEAQYRSLVRLLVGLTASLKIADEKILAHRDFAPTACPGSLAALLRNGKLRADLAACRAGRPFSFAAPRPGSSGRTPAAGPRLAVGTSPAAPGVA